MKKHEELDADWPGNRWVYLVLVVLMLIQTLLQLQYLHWPMDHDVSIYAVGAHEFLQGRSLYSELWLDRTPLVFATFGLAEWLFGYGIYQVFALAVIGKIITLLGLFQLTRVAGFGAVAGLLSAAFWVFASGGTMLASESPNMELFINASTVWALVCLINATQRANWCRWTIAAGVFFTVASFYKHNAVMVPAVMSLGLFLGLPTVQSRKRATAQVLILAGVGMVFWFGLLGYFAMVGRWTEIYNVQIRWILEWVGQTSHSKFELLTPNVLARCLMAIPCLIPAAMLMILGMGVGLFTDKNRMWWFVALFFFANHLSIAVIGERWEHYFQLWFPPICMGGGWVYWQLTQHANEHFKTWAVKLVCIGSLMTTAYMQYIIYEKSHDKFAEYRYKPKSFQSLLLGRALSEFMQPNDVVFHLGDKPGFMLTGHFRPSHGLLYHSALVNGFLKDDLTKMVIRQQAEHPGRIAVITNEFVQKNGGHPALKFLDSDYVWIKEHPFSDMFLIFVNKSDPQRDQLIEQISKMHNPSLAFLTKTQN